MSFFNMLRKSSQNLSKIQPMCLCAMMLALRIVLGIFTNFTLSFTPFAKVGLSFLPIVIIAYLYGPVCASVVSCFGDILSIILNNPSAFSIMPGITLCYFIEGFLLGVVLYEKEVKVPRISMAFLIVLALCRLPLNTLVLSLMMHIPFFEILMWRVIVLVPFAVVEVALSYFVLKTIEKSPSIRKLIK